MRLFRFANKLAEFHAQSVRQRVGNFDSNVDLTKLDRADVRPVNIGLLRKVLL